MIIKQLLDEDFVNYKKASMFIGFPSCTFKCEKDINCSGMCQNSELMESPTIDISVEELVERYVKNDITSAIVCGGLEPFDSFEDLYSFIKYLRVTKKNNDDIVIYTGYYKSEILDKLIHISNYKNIVIKYGRFIPDKESHFDDVLGIKLASDNQYAEILKPLKYKIIKNPSLSETDVSDILNDIKQNEGYCPCRWEKTPDNLCMCKEFRNFINDKKIGECHCSLYSTIISE